MLVPEKGMSCVSRWFGSVDMSEAPPAAVAVVTRLERLLDDTQPSLLQPSRSWIKSRGRGWPPPELVPPDTPRDAVPDWADSDIGIRIGHDTDSEADITVGVGHQDAVVGCFGGRITLPVTSDSGIHEVVKLAEDALRAQYVWEAHYRGGKLVQSEVAYVGIHVNGMEGRQVIQSLHTWTAWLPLPRTRVERRVVTYGLQSERQ